MNHRDRNATNNSIATACKECSPVASEPPLTTEKPAPPWTGEFLERKANKISAARYRFAAACYYSMLDEGLTWYDIFGPLTGNLSYQENHEILTALENLLQTIDKHGMPDLTLDLLESAEADQ